MRRHRDTPICEDKHEIDLLTGDLLDPVTGKIVGHLSPWRHREGVIATAMYLATECGPGSLSLFDLVLFLPAWLEKAHFFQDIRKLLNPPCSLINKALAPHGRGIERVGIMSWALRPLADRGGSCCLIRASKTADCLKTARTAMEQQDFQSAAVAAIKALRHCHESHMARLVIGTIRFRHGHQIDKYIAQETAACLLRYETGLGRARDVLTLLRQREANRRPRRWEFADEYIRGYEEQLEIHHDVFEKARAYLIEGLA
jgi:hypothetical protein